MAEDKKDRTGTGLPAITGETSGGGGDEGDRNLPATTPESGSEIQAAILLAKKFPRNEGEAQAELLTACDKEIFAEGAYYSFQRGRKKDEKTGEWKGNIVSGASIRMAREAARIYGNFRYGFFITHDDDDARGIVAWAWDCEKNNRMSSADFFKKLIQRRQGSGPDAVTTWVTADERDLRELTFRRASILVRNCILSLLPGYFVDNAVAVCKSTVAGGPKTDLSERIGKMRTSFAEIGISGDQLSHYLQKPIEASNRADLSELRGIYESLIEGVISPQERIEMFPGPPGKGDQAPAATLKESAETLRGKAEPTISEGDMKPAADQQAPKGYSEPAGISDKQRKALFAALKKAGKNEADLRQYMKTNFGIESTKELTQNQFDDLLGFASFVPPKDPPAEKKAATKKTPIKDNGDDPITDPKGKALALVAKMNKKNFMELKKQVIDLCNEIKGTDNIVQVTIALGEKQKSYGS